MKSEGLLTIFIVTYNRANYLQLCIKSILEQTYTEFQLVILDNASTDITQHIVKSFNDNRIFYIRHPKNIGGIANINYAINMCETKYFVIFHDDDIMDKDMIKAELDELEKNEEYVLVSSLCTYIDGEGKEVVNYEEIFENRISLYRDNEYLKSYLLEGGRPGVICPSVMYRSSFFKANRLLFSVDVGQAADQYLWFEVEKSGGILCIINEPLIKYRLHELQDSQINNFSMQVDLLDAINKKLLNDDKNAHLYSMLNKSSIKLSLSISKRLYLKKMTKNLYCELLDKLINEVCQAKQTIILLKLIRMITLKAPFFIIVPNYVLKLYRNIKR